MYVYEIARDIEMDLTTDEAGTVVECRLTGPNWTELMRGIEQSKESTRHYTEKKTREEVNGAVRTRLIEWARAEGWSTSRTNELLEAAGLEPLAVKWGATVTLDGEDLVIGGIEAEDEEKAERIVRDNLSITCAVTVRTTVTYDGPGEPDQYEIETEDDDEDGYGYEEMAHDRIEIRITPCEEW